MSLILGLPNPLNHRLGMSDEPSLHHVVVAVWLFAVPWSDAPSLTKPSGMARTLRVVCGSLLHWLWLTSESRNRHGGILLVLARGTTWCLFLARISLVPWILPSHVAQMERLIVLQPGSALDSPLDLSPTQKVAAFCIVP